MYLIKAVVAAAVVKTIEPFERTWLENNDFFGGEEIYVKNKYRDNIA